MVVITGTLYPHGQDAGRVELLHATISNAGQLRPGSDCYTAHVLARPHPPLGVLGFEADVEVQNHARHKGITPLLVAVLDAALERSQRDGSPPARLIKRINLLNVDMFNALIREQG